MHTGCFPCTSTKGAKDTPQHTREAIDSIEELNSRFLFATGTIKATTDLNLSTIPRRGSMGLALMRRGQIELPSVGRSSFGDVASAHHRKGRRTASDRSPRAAGGDECDSLDLCSKK